MYLYPIYLSCGFSEVGCTVFRNGIYVSGHFFVETVIKKPRYCWLLCFIQHEKLETPRCMDPYHIH